MKHKTLPVGKAVRVFWHDSAAKHGWQYDGTVGEPGRIVTLGFVVNTKKECITLTTSISTDGAVIDPLSIPWDVIKRLEEVGHLFDRSHVMPHVKKNKKSKRTSSTTKKSQSTMTTESIAISS